MSLFRRKPTWQELHPLPAGWRPRTRVDVAGRVVEPWQWMISDATGYPLDGGELWLPQRLDADAAAWEILTWWLAEEAPKMALEPHEVGGLRVSARPGAFESSWVGVAFASEAAITQ